MKGLSSLLSPLPPPAGQLGVVFNSEEQGRHNPRSNRGNGREGYHLDQLLTACLSGWLAAALP